MMQEEDGGIGGDDASPGDDGGIGGDDAGMGDDAKPDADADADAGTGDDSQGCPDLDDDGYQDMACGGLDCDDGDPAVSPDGVEGVYPDPTCSDSKDNDCDGLTDYADSTCDREWWNPDYKRRRKIYFDNLEQDALVEFPVLVGLGSGRIDYAQVQDQGQDLRFIDADGHTVLNHEIEKWDESGASIIWVKVPEIFGRSNMDYMWMYYGNPSAEDEQDPSWVWTADYEGVYHLHDDFEDSSVPSIHGTNQGSDDKACLLADCQDFDHSQSDYIDVGINKSILMNTAGCTLSAVVNPESIDTDDNIISVSVGGGSTSDSRATLALVGGNDVLIGGRANDTESLSAGETTGDLIAAGNWYYLAGVIDYSGNQLAIYVNGQFIGSTTAGFSQGTTSDTTAATSAIGAQDDGSGDFFNGDIDEVRIARTARSPDWIAAQHLSMTNAFLLFEPEEVY
jgi:biopolymer transport protein ExbB